LFFDLLTSLVYFVAWGLCGLAFWLGDRPLRVTAAAFLFFWTITPLFSLWWHDWNVPMVVVDVNALLALTWISMRWRRLWSTVLVALSFLQVLTPFLAYATHIRRFYWQSAYNVMGWVMLVVMAVAIWLTVRGRRRADEGVAQS
jgi:hypothetical protein